MSLKNIAWVLLIFLLLKNLGIINWHAGKPQIDFEGTRQGLVNSIGGSVNPDNEVNP